MADQDVSGTYVARQVNILAGQLLNVCKTEPNQEVVLAAAMKLVALMTIVGANRDKEKAAESFKNDVAPVIARYINNSPAPFREMLNPKVN